MTGGRVAVKGMIDRIDADKFSRETNGLLLYIIYKQRVKGK